MPAGVQIEPRKLEIGMPPSARRAAAGAPSVPQPRPQQPAPHPQHPPQQHQQQRAEQPATQRPPAGGLPAVAEAPPEQPAPAPEPIARAAPVPGNPLKIRLKFARGSSVPRGSPDKPISPEAAAALVQSARQLGAGLHPPLSPIPAGWAQVVSCATPPPTAQGGAGSGAISPFETVSAEEFGQLAAGSAGAAAPVAGGAPTVPAGPTQEPAGQLPQQAGLPAQPASDAAPGRSEPQREQQPTQSQQQQQQQQESERRQGAHPRQPSPPAAAAGAKRPTPPVQPSDSAAQGPGPAVKRRKSPAAAGAPEPAAASDALAAASPVVTDTPAGVLPEGSVAPGTGPRGGSHPLARPLNNSTAAAPAAAQHQPAAHAAVPEPRGRSATPTGEQRPSAAEPQQPQQQAVPQWAAEALAGRSDDSRLGVVAALLPPALQQAAGGELPGSRMVQSLQVSTHAGPAWAGPTQAATCNASVHAFQDGCLCALRAFQAGLPGGCPVLWLTNLHGLVQEEGKKLKKFAEKKMRDGRPTHVSSMFLCQARSRPAPRAGSLLRFPSPLAGGGAVSQRCAPAALAGAGLGAPRHLSPHSPQHARHSALLSPTPPPTAATVHRCPAELRQVPDSGGDHGGPPRKVLAREVSRAAPCAACSAARLLFGCQAGAACTAAIVGPGWKRAGRKGREDLCTLSAAASVPPTRLKRVPTVVLTIASSTQNVPAHLPPSPPTPPALLPAARAACTPRPPPCWTVARTTRGVLMARP